MKKLLMLLVLVVIFSCTFTTPIFAGQPPDEAHNGLERVFEGDGNDQSWQGLYQGLIAPVYYGRCPNAWFGPIVAYYQIKSFGI
jgi:hypothetical protein